MEAPTCAGCRERDAIIAKLLARIAALEESLAEQAQRLTEQAQRLTEQAQRLAAYEQRIAELEARLKMNSTNSSLPPSANPPSAPKPSAKPPTGRKPGGQPGHPGHGRPRLPADQLVLHRPAACAHCHAALSPEAGPHDPPPRWHQVFEVLRVLVHVTEHQAHGRICAVCGRVTWGVVPAEALAHGYGPHLTALIALLSGRCHASKRTIEEVLESLFGVPISLGSVVKAEAEVAAALEAPYASAEAAVKEAPVKNADETGWSRAGKLCWLWMAVAGSVALFQICPGRGRQALGTLLGKVTGGVVGSDRWTAYGLIDLLYRQVCWAHLKRDFQKWVDWGGPAVEIGQAGLQAVKQVFEAWRRFREGVLDRPGLQAALGPVSHDLQAALEAGLSSPNRKVGRFCRNVLGVYPALWTFAREEGVEPTNNRAERTLRPAVLWRRISFGNHSEGGCRFAERILTVVQTLRLQHRPVLSYLRDAVAAHRARLAPPALVPVGA